MIKVYTCIGRYAGTPYTIKKDAMHIYCIEELCFYIRQNACFMEDDFFDMSLITWIEEECNLPAIARQLKTRMRQQAHMDDMVQVLFDAIGYYDKNEIAEIRALLVSGSNMSDMERAKIRGDYFLRNKKYALAQEAYGMIINNGAMKERDRKYLAGAYNNMGVIYAHLFMYDNAAEYFKRAYETMEVAEYLESYVAALRMSKPEKIFLKMVNDIPGGFEAAASVEQRMSKSNAEYDTSDANDRICKLVEACKMGNKDNDNEELRDITGYLKDEYRAYMGR